MLILFSYLGSHFVLSKKLFQIIGLSIGFGKGIGLFVYFIVFYFFLLLKMHPNFSIVKHLLHDTHLAR